MNEQKSGTEEPPAKRMRRTYNLRKWWTCWGIDKYQWQYPALQEAFIRIYSMKHRAPFSAIPEYIFREILTYVDLEECHRLKMQKVFDEEEKSNMFFNHQHPTCGMRLNHARRRIARTSCKQLQYPVCPTVALNQCPALTSQPLLLQHL